MEVTLKRTHSCGQLCKGNVGQRVTLMGWVHRRRDHGGLIFIDLRDREGLTQVVFNPEVTEAAHRKARQLRSEYVVAIEGEVCFRPPGTINSKLSTGEIEVIATNLEILNESKTPPFEIVDEIEVVEDVRLKYRYLDLRRPTMQKIIVLKHKAIQAVRDFLSKEGFLEIETPILTKSTPEGARDYLVPSRLNPGHFYALPQSPQLFKQLLMISGLDRYFQISRCFRDEDLRADRQPEFTQIDFEMSFVDEEDVIDVTERLMVNLFRTVLGAKIGRPFERMNYSDVLEKYGTDSPDIRSSLNEKEYKFLWIVDFPLLEFDAEEGRFTPCHHPFTAPRQEDIARLHDQPQKVRARAYDLVLNGVEIGGGSIRIHDRGLQEEMFRALSIDSKEASEKFGFLLEALEYGAPPHGGIALGLDRLLMVLAGRKTIREVIAFPKTQSASSPLTQAPSSVSPHQLRELHIRLR